MTPPMVEGRSQRPDRKAGIGLTVRQDANEFIAITYEPHVTPTLLRYHARVYDGREPNTRLAT